MRGRLSERTQQMEATLRRIGVGIVVVGSTMGRGDAM